MLAEGVAPLRVLHISDVHLTPGRHRLLSWIRSLDALEPDLVINTGDSIAHRAAVGPFLEALGPLLDRPGVFVYGSNDLYSPVFKNPTRYLWRTSAMEHSRDHPDLPWGELGAGMEAAGWLNLNNRRGRIKVGEHDIEVAGVHDSHINRDRYDLIAGQADPAADLRLGVLHSPEPGNIDRFTADGFNLLLAGHTHGGQVCLPVNRALVTNCGIDRARASGLTGPRFRRRRSSVAARVGGSRHVAICPSAAVLSAGGYAAHAGPADQLDCSRAVSGVWRSLVARFVRDEEAAGSNPVTPTQVRGHLRSFAGGLFGGWVINWVTTA